MCTIYVTYAYDHIYIYIHMHVLLIHIFIDIHIFFTNNMGKYCAVHQYVTCRSLQLSWPVISVETGQLPENQEPHSALFVWRNRELQKLITKRFSHILYIYIYIIYVTCSQSTCAESIVGCVPGGNRIGGRGRGATGGPP